jgi:hypothetical protein
MVASSGKVALIVGVTGQDGAYLAEFLATNNNATRGRPLVFHAAWFRGLNCACALPAPRESSEPLSRAV